jgi:4-amino-4-deoxy-L-arabinose transferase-like glycosyltransferase
VKYRLRKVSISPIGWALLLFGLALAPRLPGLRLFLTTDEPFFIQQAAAVMLAFLKGNFAGTYWHFYPGVTISWLGGLGLGGQWLLARLASTSGQPLAAAIQGRVLDVLVGVRLPFALLTAGGVAGFYLLGRRLLGHRTAWLGALFIAFDPFFLAHSRVMHGDAPVTVFMGLSALALFIYVRAASPGGARRWLLVSAVLGALSALTKAPGQFMALFVVLLLAGDWLLMSRRDGHLDRGLAWQRLKDVALWGVVAGVVFVALWPAMWTDPLGSLTRMLDETFTKVEEGHLIFFMGQPVLRPDVWFYPYVIPFRLTPVTSIAALGSLVLVAGGLGGLVARRGDTTRSGPYVAAGLLWLFVVSLLVFGELSPKKQDRYLLPLFPVLDLLAAFAILQVVEWAVRHIPLGRAGRDSHSEAAGPGVSRIPQQALVIGLPFILLLLHSFPVVSGYPYYLAYFNPLMGGLPRAVETTLVGWGEGMEQAAAYLNELPDADRLYVAAVPAQTFLPYFEGKGENFYTNDVALRADYVVLYMSQVQRLAPSPEIVRHFLAMKPEHVVTVQGMPYAWIYAGPKLITTHVPAGATLTNIGFGDQIRLAGFRIEDAAGPEVALYWHALVAMQENYAVSVRLVAANGDWLAQQDSWPAGGLLPTSQWRPGDYVCDVHRLDLPPDAVVDHLQIVVYNAASGEPLGGPVDVQLSKEASQ